MINPIKQIEEQKLWMDMGKQALLIYRGALEEGATNSEALLIVSGFYAGMFRGAREDDDSNRDTETK